MRSQGLCFFILPFVYFIISLVLSLDSTKEINIWKNKKRNFIFLSGYRLLGPESCSYSGFCSTPAKYNDIKPLGYCGKLLNSEII